jgi:hypothetical protein
VLRARYLASRRIGAFGIALTAWDIWRRLPKSQRKMIIRQARLHAPTVARGVARQVRQAREFRANWNKP